MAVVAVVNVWDAGEAARQPLADGISSVESSPPGTLERLLDAFNAHDLDTVMGFFAEDCVLETPRGPNFT